MSFENISTLKLPHHKQTSGMASEPITPSAEVLLPMNMHLVRRLCRSSRSGSMCTAASLSRARRKELFPRSRKRFRHCQGH